jgi:hypothetical protein
VTAWLVEDDLEGAIRELKAERDGEIEVAEATPAAGFDASPDGWWTLYPVSLQGVA